MHRVEVQAKRPVHAQVGDKRHQDTHGEAHNLAVPRERLNLPDIAPVQLEVLLATERDVYGELLHGLPYASA